MNILLINHYAGSLRDGMEYRPYYMAREWVRAGHQVQILASGFSHLRTHQPEMAGAVKDEQIDGLAYRWYRAPRYATNGLGRIRNMLSFLWAVWRRADSLAAEFAPDVVIASSTYPMDIWPARRIARKTKARLVYEVHDLWPLSPMALGKMSKWHPFILWVQVAEDLAYRWSDAVVSMLPKTLPYMQSRGLDPKKWHFVPNGMVTSEWEHKTALPERHQQVLETLRRNGVTLLGYAGSHGVANALDNLLAAAALLPSGVHIVLVGNGPEKERLMMQARAQSLDHVHFLDVIEKSAIPAFLEAVDIAYIGWLPNPMYRFGISPNKLMDYMMAAKPVIHSVDAGNDLVQEAGCGVSIPPNAPAAVKEAVEYIMSLSPEQRGEMGVRGRNYVQKHHDYAILGRQFVDAVA